MKLTPFFFVLLYLSHASGQPLWSDLNFEQQKTLLAFQDRWQTLEPSVKESLIENANEWNHKSQEEKRRAYLKLKKFNRLPKEEQERIKRRAQRFKRMSPQERRTIKQAKHFFDALSPQERKRIKRKYQHLPEGQRKPAIKRFVSKQKFHRFIKQFEPYIRSEITHMLENLPQKSRKLFRSRIQNASNSKKKETTLTLLRLSEQQRIVFISTMPSID